MMNDAEWAQLMDLSMTAGMNVRYWGEIESSFHCWQAVFVSAIVGMLLSQCIAAISLSEKVRGVFGIAAFLLGGLAIAIAWTAPQYDQHPGSFRQSWENLRRDCDAAIEADDFSRYPALFARKELINSWEPPANRELLIRSLEAEEAARMAEATNEAEAE